MYDIRASSGHQKCIKIDQTLVREGRLVIHFLNHCWFLSDEGLMYQLRTMVGICMGRSQYVGVLLLLPRTRMGILTAASDFRGKGVDLWGLLFPPEQGKRRIITKKIL
jgi:hypothetical protein